MCEEKQQHVFTQIILYKAIICRLDVVFVIAVTFLGLCVVMKGSTINYMKNQALVLFICVSELWWLVDWMAWERYAEWDLWSLSIHLLKTKKKSEKSCFPLFQVCRNRYHRRIRISNRQRMANCFQWYCTSELLC